MRAVSALMAGALALAGCTATPITVTCDPFHLHYSSAVPRSSTLDQIQGDLPPQVASPRAATAKTADAEGFENLIALTLPQAFAPEEDEDGALLALSGGGQWGAFGAGYLQALDQDKPLPRFSAITGVSTGALQALFVSANQAQGGKPTHPLAALVTQYSPASESEIVSRSGYVGAVFNGSVAKLGPLRKRIETALCEGRPDNPTVPGHCPLIEYLASNGAPTVLLGFVEAGSGDMRAVNVTAIARDAVNPVDPARAISMKTAQQCITGGALASVAMPFFYQQVQITSRHANANGQAESRALTYYDGGVRQSMFLLATTAAITALDAQRSAALDNGKAALPGVQRGGRRIYLVRNGPTVATADDRADAPRGAIPTAERGYSLIVNQSEVTAIEAIRLRDSTSVMRLVTADGYNRRFADPRNGKLYPAGCQKQTKSAMFEPQFMACLQAFGRFKATGGIPNSRPDGWITLARPTGSTPTAP